MALQDLSAELSAVMDEAQEGGLFSAVCTVQERTNTVSALGQPDLSDWVDIVGLVDLVAMVSIHRALIPDQGATVRTAQDFETMTQIHVLLNGYYPAIQQQNQLLVTEGSYAGTYEIMAVEADSQARMTRLAVRVWTL